MDKLFTVGERMAQDNRVLGGLDPTTLAHALVAGGCSDPTLAELLGGDGDIEKYLQSYEQMLQDGPSGDNSYQTLGQVDAEGGITVRPDPGFVVKTRDAASGMKVFINVVSSEHVEKPHMKSFTELDGEEGCRVPLSVGTPVEDFDKKQEPCVTYDLVANPEVVEECLKTPAFRESVVQLCLAAVCQKYKVELDPQYKLPKIKYKGGTVQLQRIRKKRDSQIQEVPGSTSSTQAIGADSAGSAGGGPSQPEFAIYYSLRDSALLEDPFNSSWGPPPEDPRDAEGVPYLNGLDLPCYRINPFQERIRGTMCNKAAGGSEDDTPSVSSRDYGRADTLEMLMGRTCVVSVRLTNLDPHIPALKQFGAEISDECLRISFPLLPRSGRAAYSPLTLWWPVPFWTAQAAAHWDPKRNTFTVSLPTELPPEVTAFDPELLEAIF